MSTRPLIKETLLLLNVYGVDPYKQNNNFSKLRFAFPILLLLATGFNVSLDIIFKWKGLNSMQSVAIIIAVMQILTKLWIIATNRANFVDVINKMKQFWPLNKYGSGTEIENIYKFGKNIIKLMLVFLLLGVFIFYGTTIFFATRKLAFPMYFPTDLNGFPDYEIAFMLQISVSLTAGFFMVIFDFLFVSLIINITCELKIIKKGFEKIPIKPEIKGDTEESLKQVYEIIEHHNLILDCIKNVREIYSFWLLNIYFYNMIAMCVGMLSIIATGFPPTLQNLAQYGYVTFYFMAQLYFYCSTGQHLIAESESVSETVYEIDWWIKRQPKLRNALVLVIQRANKVENLTAGGMFALNLASFRKVTRSALSFFTLVNAVYKDS